MDGLRGAAWPRQKTFFEGQVYDAFEFLIVKVQKAERGITLIGCYADAGTLNILAKKRDGVDAAIWTHPRTHLTQRDIAAFNAKYPPITEIVLIIRQVRSVWLQ